MFSEESVQSFPLWLRLLYFFTSLEILAETLLGSHRKEDSFPVSGLFSEWRE